MTRSRSSTRRPAPTEPVEEIDGSATPNGKFVSLRDAAVAVDDFNGDVYLTDDLQPANTESPVAAVYAFDSEGNYEGHLKRNTFDGGPSGLAVDNSSSARYPAGTQGRVYVTTGNTQESGLYAYPPEAATTATALAPTVPGPPLSSGVLFPHGADRRRGQRSERLRRGRMPGAAAGTGRPDPDHAYRRPRQPAGPLPQLAADLRPHRRRIEEAAKEAQAPGQEGQARWQVAPGPQAARHDPQGCEKTPSARRAR